ncbi:glutathione S-transferase family protein [Neopusillimonas maritima]|jgi:putative glutathione S-transferase|uniref:Glutathione-dependent reductase n=1 Tax=Neopusillimonas maritima TaxID=2026239 RepID=A0ABX9MTJ8_9BURK|nr:glutathione S-transferase family protein [Neopusillimonas maritima]MBF24694.1 glutathione-dependent reductase [Pusillimonas sp.]RII82235.1 glutathione-dependent reductase [Neopusillimonas maritima]|tara:strand:- start:175640 stop:176623 length:984 start_codon:yes stop_codon:yes gene_type:complete
MGLLVDGKWHDDWYDTKKTGGRFIRTEAQFRNWVTADGAAGPTGEGGFKAEPGRYHLYVSLACPWAHRTLIFRKLKGLENMIDISIVHFFMGRQGWSFEPGEGVVPDTVNHCDYVHQLYTLTQPDYTGRVTIPILWDKERKVIVSNESSEIIRMFNSAFDDIGAKEGDYYPVDLHQEINAVNELVYNSVNNGVYRSGFATTQDAYDEAVTELFDALESLELRLSRQRYLTGDRITEADWRLFTTLVRFDPVYHGHFKCNLKRIVDMPNLWGFTRELYQWHGVAETVDFKHIKNHYYQSHATVNPTGVVPKGPDIDFTTPHHREPPSV